jgi:DNA-directed RNA polymerase subunit L
LNDKLYKGNLRVEDMEIEIIKQEKNEVELKIDNLTIAEALRFKLNEQGVKFAAWRREHPSKPLIFRIESNSGVKKDVSEAVKAIKKELDGLKVK